MNIENIQNDLINEFSVFKGWEEKYEYIIELGYNLPKLSQEQKNADTLIKGCQSKAWLYAEMNDGKVWYYADSEAVIIKGLIALMIRVVSGYTPEEIFAATLFFIKRTGLSDHFSNRSTGLMAMENKIKYYAATFQSTTN